MALRPWAMSRGSSPLTRGKPFLLLLAHHDGGLIPAHAGKTRPPAHSRSSSRAHPRSRGENHSPPRSTSSPWGSSPLTREKRSRAHGIQPGPGLIPAHAGKTCSAWSSSACRRAHPRSRGENTWASSGAGRAAGSSPLTRGKPRTCCRGARRSGLIPAHAGKTLERERRCAAERAHPRSRGENLAIILRQLADQGSSPLTRGKLMTCCRGERRSGLIPAHAGKTMRPAPV